MRVVSLLQLPELEKQVADIAPSAELVVLDRTTPPSDDLTGDILLTPAYQTPHLETMLEPGRGFRWIHIYGTGVDGFPLSRVGERMLTCSRGAAAVPIAEWVMAMMLASVKQLPASWITQPPEHWYVTGNDILAGKRVALFGFGNIGSAVASRAMAFGMEVSASVRAPRPLMEGVRVVAGIANLVADADFLVLAAPATPATRHVVNRELLSRARPGLRLINISRGSLIDQDALRWALDKEIVAEAYLDTVEPEPLPMGHWLYEHPRVKVSPHVSWGDPGGMLLMAEKFYANLARFVEGQPLHGLVNLEAGY